MTKLTDKIKMVKVSEKQILNKKDTRIRIYNKDKTKMNVKEIKDLYKYLKDNDKKGKYEVLILGRNNMRLSTIKPFSLNEIVDFDEDYYNRYGGEIDTDYFYLDVYLRETIRV
jgi:hypothetical protein